MDRRNFVKLGLAAGSLTVSAAAAQLAGAAPWAAAQSERDAVAPTGVDDVARGVQARARDAATRAQASRDARAWRAARRFVSTSMGRVAVVQRGAGPQAALFLHGLPLNSFQWRGAVARLAPQRRCIAPDFLGLGYSAPAPGASLDPEGQVAMLAELLDQLGVAQVDVVASDSGGAVAQLLLVLHPERVRSLLLANCDTEIDSPPPAMLPVIELARQGQFAQQWLAPWLADKDKARAPDALGGACYERPDALADEVFDTYLRPLVEHPQRLHAYIRALERNPLFGIRPALRASTAPVRVLWGMADTIFLPRGADYLEQAFGNSRGVRRIEGGKLFWPEERPDLLAQEALALWRDA